MNKFYIWMTLNRTKIGYVIGCMLMLNALVYFVLGDIFAGVCWLFAGGAILLDLQISRD